VCVGPLGLLSRTSDLLVRYLAVAGLCPVQGAVGPGPLGRDAHVPPAAAAGLAGLEDDAVVAGLVVEGPLEGVRPRPRGLAPGGPAHGDLGRDGVARRRPPPPRPRHPRRPQPPLLHDRRRPLPERLEDLLARVHRPYVVRLAAEARTLFPAYANRLVTLTVQQAATQGSSGGWSLGFYTVQKSKPARANRSSGGSSRSRNNKWKGLHVPLYTGESGCWHWPDPRCRLWHWSNVRASVNLCHHPCHYHGLVDPFY
jgi:hypothetical protein